MRVFLPTFSLFLSLLLPVSGAYAENGNPDHLIPNFQTVHAGGLYRGGTPGEQGIQFLKSIGVKTIVSLEGRHEVLEAEQKAAAAAGMNWFAAPMSAVLGPKDWEVNMVLAILSDPAMQPAFIHCRHGRDRTGLLSGLYRVEIDRWDPAQAYGEMLRLGYRPFHVGATRYFKKRTGYKD